MIDDEVSSVGSANMDFRSFELNFEINAFVYDKEIAQHVMFRRRREEIKTSYQRKI